MNTIDAKLLARMFLAGAKNLEVKKEWINELNVFPVPDGDTGTNMTMTIMSAAKEVSGSGRPVHDDHAGKSYFFRISTRRTRKLRCYSLSAASWIYQRQSSDHERTGCR